MNFFNPKYGRFFKLPRQIVKYITSSLYPIVIKIWPLPEVLSIEDTIDKIADNNLSIIRFGDGEILYVVERRNLPFQEYDTNLATILKQILKSTNPGLIVGLPDAYRIGSDNLSVFWKSQIAWYYPRFSKYLLNNKAYYNASITRLYYGSKDINKCKGYFEKMMGIWTGRNVLLIEGEKTRFGIGNDLLRDAASVQRILGPYHNGFRRYKEIEQEAMKHSRDKLILVALGPAAKAITYDLALAGFQAVDIGNLDIEYEWFKNGVTERVKVQGKYTSEVIGGRIVEDIIDPIYESQIIAKFI